jgi:hypothetical protein
MPEGFEVLRCCLGVSVRLCILVEAVALESEVHRGEFARDFMDSLYRSGMIELLDESVVEHGYYCSTAEEIRSRLVKNWSTLWHRRTFVKRENTSKNVSVPKGWISAAELFANDRIGPRNITCVTPQNINNQHSAGLLGC